MFHRRLLGIWLLFACMTMASAQTCRTNSGSDNAPSEPFKKKLWDGYEVSLGPSRTVTDGDDCTAAIYNKAGKVVYRTKGYNVDFDDDETGEDFDGDGHPEVVFKTDSGGGNRGTWTYHVVSLYPKPHLLVDIPQSGQVEFSKDRNGRMLIKSMRFVYGLTPEASNPLAREVEVVEIGKLKNVTPEHCAEIEAGQDYQSALGTLTPDMYGKFNDNKLSSSEEEDFTSQLLSVALQQALCEQHNQVIETLAQVHQPRRGKFQKALAESLGDHPLFAKRLQSAP